MLSRAAYRAALKQKISYFYIYILFMILFLLSKNIASLVIAQTVTFFTGTIFYKKALKFAKQLYNCFYAFKVLCFYIKVKGHEALFSFISIIK